MNFLKSRRLILGGLISLLFLYSCEEFFEPDQELVVRSDEFFKEWSEYRAASMGLYSMQQELVEQLVVLGELRGDLLEITPNADRDLIEVYNFQITQDNRYASPINFYKLISACNRLIRQLETDHPEVLDKSQENTVYDQLYGEVLCMRAWTYFNAVRIYGEIPYIWPTITTVDEIREYVNSGTQFIDTLDIIYDPGGLDNDTIRNKEVVLEKKYIGLPAVIDTFTTQLENKIKAVGVNHYMNNNDITWEVTVWNTYAMHCLLGQMYLFDDNMSAAYNHFAPIMFNYTSETSDIRFGLDSRFEGSKWRNIFSGIDIYEHILTLWFGKSYQQQHDLQKLFSKEPPNSYMLKPTAIAVHNWESMWDGMVLSVSPSDPSRTKTARTGMPGDFHRGHSISFAYMLGEIMLEEEYVRDVLQLKKQGLYKDVRERMQGVDTVVYKYTFGKSRYDKDANFIIYRAGGIHLYFAEIYARREYIADGIIRRELLQSLNVLNDGWYNQDNQQLGVRGRVGFSDRDEAIKISNIVYTFDPFTNQVNGWLDLTNNLQGKQEYIEEKVIEERARELAFEGERFYDLMRVAKRKNDPAYLADRVAAKFSGEKAEQIHQHLMDEKNWYVPLFNDL